jgi:hypothetical protein
VLGIVSAMAVVVAVLGVLSTGTAERARVGTVSGDQAATGTTTPTAAGPESASPATEPATVLGEVIEREDIAEHQAATNTTEATTTAPGPRATAPAPQPSVTQPPTTPPPTTQPPATQPPVTQPPVTQPPPNPVPEPEPETVIVEVVVRASSDEPIEVQVNRVDGSAGTHRAVLPRQGGSATFDGLPPGTYEVVVTTVTYPPEEQADPTLGPTTNVERSPRAQIGPGEQLTAVYDGSAWTLVLN